MSRMRRNAQLVGRGQGSVPRTKRRGSLRAPYRRRLQIEPLESRRLLAAFSVTNLGDAVVTMAGDAPGTLRQAIFDANASPGPDVINFAAGLSGTITLTEGELSITGSGTIGGPGAVQLTIDASGNDPTPDQDNGDGSRIFNIDDQSASLLDVKITGLTLTGGDANAFGGAIRSVEGLTVRDSIITGNSAYSAAGFLSAGGGIYNDQGGLTIENSTISNNFVYHDSFALGGGIAIGNGNLTVINSTISGNRANSPFGAGGGTSYAGGIGLGDGTHLIAHSTIADNRAVGSMSEGGGLLVYGSPAITLDHTIVGDNSASMGRDIFSSGDVTARFSLIENTVDWTLDDAGNNILGQDPHLFGLGIDHGGGVPVQALQADSPAIDAGDPMAVAGIGGVPTTDQRGTPFVRVADGDDNASSVIDIGAFERQTLPGLSLIVDTTVDENDGDVGPGDLSLREAIGLANGSVGPDTITFSPLIGGKTIFLTEGELTIVDDATIDAASGAGSIIIDASGSDPTPNQNLGDGARIFNIDDQDFNVRIDVELRGLTLTGGDESNDGGAIFSEENLVLSGVTVRDNHAADIGGGLTQRNGTLLVENSTFSGNVASTGSLGSGSGGFSGRGGGALFLYQSDAEIINSTISGNRAVGDFREGGGITAGYMPLVIRHSTISGNTIQGTDSRGGNIYFRGHSTSLELDHTIVANGTANMGTDISSPNDPIVANFSLIEDVTGLTLNGTGNTTGLDPILGPLVDNGGVTKTHALLAGSPAIDAGQFTFVPPPDFDQRGTPFLRLANGDGDAFTIIDIGAYERQTVAGLSLVVDTTADENDGNYSAGDLSLREAVGLANGSIGSNTITFAPELVGKTILLTLGELQIVDDLMIDATSLNGHLTIDASGNDPTPSSPRSGDGSRIFRIDDGDNARFLDVELRGLTLTGGDALDLSGGGAILNSENLTVRQSTITGNSVQGAPFGPPGGPYVTLGGRGGGIHVQSGGTLTLVASTVDSNYAAYGGGLSIFDGELAINSSTISGNRASADGGGVWATGGTTTVTAIHSTIATNGVGSFLVVGEGGGIWADAVASVSLDHTIVADNFALASPDVSSATAVSFFYGLVENGGGFSAVGGPQFIGVDPLLAPLADYGGPTRTHALMDGSPAIDMGDLSFTSPPDFDQRGGPFVRKFDGNGDTFPRIDIGAYERQSLPGLSLVVDTTDDLTDGLIGPGELSLREAVGLANGSIGSDTITFAGALSGQTILLLQGELIVVDSASIDADNLPGGVVIDASGNDPTPSTDSGDGSRIFAISDGNANHLIDVELTRLTLVGGDVLGNGGAIESSENLTLVRSTVSGNAAASPSGMAAGGGSGLGGVFFSSGAGGGIVQTVGDLVIDGSTISGNSALGQGLGGGIAAGNLGSFTLLNSTVSGNYAAASGGGLYAGYIGVTDLRHSTISDNQAAGSGGGVRQTIGSPALYHTIVANNNAGGSGPDISGGSVPLVYSLVEDPSGFTPTSGPRIVGTDPMLGPLADNGGPTQTHALLAGSPAIDAGEFGIVGPPDFDQRGAGFPRIVDGNSDTFAVIDMGAFEYDPNPNALVGDYNSSGTVDAADYTVWRNHLGQNFTLDNESPTAATPGVVDQEDYGFWKANFGQTLPAAGSGSMASPLLASPVVDEAIASTEVTSTSSPLLATRTTARSLSSTVAVDRALVELSSLRPTTRRSALPAERSPLRATSVQTVVADQELLLAIRSADRTARSDGPTAPTTRRKLAADGSESTELRAGLRGAGELNRLNLRIP